MSILPVWSTYYYENAPPPNICTLNSWSTRYNRHDQCAGSRDPRCLVTLQWGAMWMPRVQPMAVRDMWRHEGLGNFSANFSAFVPPHGIVAIRLRQLPYQMPRTRRVVKHDDETATAALTRSILYRGTAETRSNPERGFPRARSGSPAPSPFGWPFTWGQIPTAMFGCNTSGLENASQMAFNARFGITIYEARTMMELHNYTDTAHWLQVQAAAMKAAHPAEPLFVYRSASGTDAFFTLGNAIVANATRRREWLLHFQPDPKTGKLKCDPGGFGCSDYDFRVPAMREYYLTQIIPEVAAEPHIEGVFFDDCDTVVGGARSGKWLSVAERAAISNA